MKKTKAVSLLLIASMIMPMTGCSLGKKNKAVNAAKAYAEAVLSGEVEDIADLMEDGDEFEETMEAFFNNSSAEDDDELTAIYDFILENMSYKIDKKSVVIKDYRASVDITYTIIDYEEVFDDLDEDADLEDFLSALEDSKKQTTTIEQTIKLELDKDEYKVIDKDYANIYEVYSFYSDIKALGFGVDFGAVTLDQFKSAVSAVFGDDDPYVYECEFFIDCNSYANGAFASIDINTSLSDAEYSFSSYYDEFTGMVEDGSFTGDYSYFYDGNTTGYIFVDGESDNANFFYGDIYGAIFINYDTVLVVMTTQDRESSRNAVDDLLTELGMPCPEF